MIKKRSALYIMHYMFVLVCNVLQETILLYFLHADFYVNPPHAGTMAVKIGSMRSVFKPDIIHTRRQELAFIVFFCITLFLNLLLNVYFWCLF